MFVFLVNQTRFMKSLLIITGTYFSYIMYANPSMSRGTHFSVPGHRLLTRLFRKIALPGILGMVSF
jgi:ABC-type multidrug transport system permease subunit